MKVQSKGETIEDKEINYIKEMTLELQAINLKKSSNEQKLAFYINIYNSLMIHSIILFKDLPIFKNTEDFQSYLNFVSYNIGGLNISLNKIKERILFLFQKLICNDNNYNELSITIVLFSLATFLKGCNQIIIPINDIDIINVIVNKSRDFLINNIIFKKGIKINIILKKKKKKKKKVKIYII
jgi:hypothetical protein